MVNTELANIIQEALHDDCDCKQQQTAVIQPIVNSNLPLPTEPKKYIYPILLAVVVYQLIK